MCWPSWFSGPGFHPAPASTLVSEPEIVPCASILLYGPLDTAWICCPQLPHHPCKNGTHSTCFYSTGGHTPRHALHPEIIAKLIPKTLFHVTEMRFSKKIIPKNIFPCNSLNHKRIRDMYFSGNEFPKIHISCNRSVIFGEITLRETKNYVCNLFWPECKNTITFTKKKPQECSSLRLASA